jgi:hypothetical protein
MLYRVPASRSLVDEQRARFVSEPMSVPDARHFVADRVASCGFAELVEDAALLATELSANAALHSHSRYFDVVVRTTTSAVRIGVEDEGAVSASGVVMRPSPLAEVGGAELAPGMLDAAGHLDGANLTDLLEEEPGSGRGLVIVAALADRWGIDRTGSGKIVWGEFVTHRGR